VGKILTAIKHCGKILQERRLAAKMGTGIKVATFQQRFAALFEESGKTIMELSKELHISNQTVSAWKTGARSPKEPTVIAIAKHFKVNVAWLMGYDVDKMEPEEETRPIFTPDSEMWRLIITNMTIEDYEMVRDAFNRTERRLREEGRL
jgi:transcriptional regulator with XRE-family HTH domain